MARREFEGHFATATPGDSVRWGDPTVITPPNAAYWQRPLLFWMLFLRSKVLGMNGKMLPTNAFSRIPSEGDELDFMVRS